MNFLLHFLHCRQRVSTVWRHEEEKNSGVAKYIYFHIADFACCENESSEYYRQDLVSLIPDDTEVIRSVNDSYIISCTGTDIKWKNPSGKYVTNFSGRVHVVDLSTPNDDVHVLRLAFLQIENVDIGVWTCEGNYGKRSFEMKIYGKIFLKNLDESFLKNLFLN